MAAMLLVVAAVTACTSAEHAPPTEPKPAAATSSAALPSCSSTWTLAAKVTRDQAAAACVDGGATLEPMVMACAPALYNGVKVELVVGPGASHRYAVFVDGDKSSEVDDGTGTGDYKDNQTAAEQITACGGTVLK